MSESQDLCKTLSWANVLFHEIWQPIRRELDSFAERSKSSSCFRFITGLTHGSLELSWKEGHSSQLACELTKRRAWNNYKRLAVIVQMRKIHKGRN